MKNLWLTYANAVPYFLDIGILSGFWFGRERVCTI